jgi:diguanylate cyclase (GGDEF)-like protein
MFWTLNKERKMSGQYHSLQDFMEEINQECYRVQRYQRPAALAMLGVENMGQLTAKHGKAGRDIVISLVVDKLQENLRQSDSFCRYGDFLFALLLPETDTARADEATHRIDVLLKEINAGLKDYSLTAGYNIRTLGPEFSSNATAALDIQAQELAEKIKF